MRTAGDPDPQDDLLLLLYETNPPPKCRLGTFNKCTQSAGPSGDQLKGEHLAQCNYTPPPIPAVWCN
jgi:hypothetical protein